MDIYIYNLLKLEKLKVAVNVLKTLQTLHKIETVENLDV